MSTSEQRMSWAKRNPERVKEIKRAFRERHKDRIKAERAAAFQADKAKRYAERQKWIDANPEMVAAQALRARLRKMHRALDSDLRFHYQVTADQYAKINEAQGGVCAICRKPNDTTRTKRLFVDHNHTTGRLRALLCHSCNAGLGYFREDPALFPRAVAYLRAFDGEPEHEAWDEDAILVLGRVDGEELV